LGAGSASSRIQLSSTTSTRADEEQLIAPPAPGWRLMQPVNQGDAALLAEFCHYAPYFLAAYSSFLLVYMKPLTSGCLMCYECTASDGLCCCACKPKAKVSEGDNLCSTHQAATLAFIRENDAELVYSCFENVLYPPFAIFLDRKKMAVIISVRGTMSLEDCVRDLDIQVCIIILIC